jgi:hypothetical protein
MKKVILILGLSLISLTAFADNDSPLSAPSTKTNIDMLKPITPSEATFEDIDSVYKMAKMDSLKPVTPKEATFEN